MPAATPPHSRLGWRVALLLLLPAEILLVTLGFEPGRMSSRSSWAATLVEQSSVLLRVVIAAAATFALIVSPRFSRVRSVLADDRRRHPAEWLVLHFVCFAGFVQFTGWLFAGGAGRHLAPYTVGWILLGLAVALTWLLAIAPAGAWRSLIATERTAIGASLVAAVAVWLFGLVAQHFWRPLAEATLFVAQALVGAVYPNVDYDPVKGTIGTSHLLLEIAPQCSGYEGIALVTVFVSLYLWLFRERMRFPRALWLLPAGWIAMWLANVARIAALVMVGTSISPDIATKGFHSQAGWIAFTAIALALIALSHRLGLVTTDPAPSVRRADSPAPALLVPLIAMLAGSMVAAAFSSGFDALYPLGVVATALALWAYRRHYREFEFAVSPVAIGIGFAVFGLWMLLTGPQASGPAKALPEMPTAMAALWIAFRVVGSVITVPIAEELAFRGYLLRKLVSSDFERVPPRQFTVLSFAVSSVLFGLMHQGWIAGAIAGAGFAAAVYYRGRLWDAVVAHVTANALIAVAVLGFGRWDLWL
ncbi:MAG: exosortase E/protease, VPEID-CTERM system [Betaproteobacteria bacterium]|nr:exosortase E/protease, VPEID-CTERM system [Betaproteobacteria bacterium]